MFGPNSISEFSYDMRYSHRTNKFKNLYKNCKELVLKKFDLSEYDLIFAPGSGTTGMEIVISSLKDEIKVTGNEGKFKTRWLEYAKNNNKYNKNSNLNLFCQLETSTGEAYYEEAGIVDAISSFPYYKIPKGTKCFVTCSNKQLGAFPGLALIFVRKDSWDIFQKKDYFCTKDIMLYKKYSEENQTPTTCPVQIFSQLRKVLKSFNVKSHRKKINKNCDMFSNTVKINNDMPCPVINFSKKEIPKKIAFKYELYNHNNEKKIYQIFSYSNKTKKYKQLLKDIKNAKRN